MNSCTEPTAGWRLPPPKWREKLLSALLGLRFHLSLSWRTFTLCTATRYQIFPPKPPDFQVLETVKIYHRQQSSKEITPDKHKTLVFYRGLFSFDVLPRYNYIDRGRGVEKSCSEVLERIMAGELLQLPVYKVNVISLIKGLVWRKQFNWPKAWSAS